MGIIALAPGRLFHGSHERGLEAKLYLTWLWEEQPTFRHLGRCLSFFLRPLEPCFPLIVDGRRWIFLGCGVKPKDLMRRLALAAEGICACVKVNAGDPIFPSPESAQ